MLLLINSVGIQVLSQQFDCKLSAVLMVLLMTDHQLYNMCLSEPKRVHWVLGHLRFVFFRARSPTGLATKESATRKTSASSRRRPTSMPWRPLWEPGRARTPRTLPTPQVPEHPGPTERLQVAWKQWNTCLSLHRSWAVSWGANYALRHWHWV